MKARGSLESDYQGANFEAVDPKRYAQLVAESDKVLTF
jgi:hypothetical protein